MWWQQKSSNEKSRSKSNKPRAEKNPQQRNICRWNIGEESCTFIIPRNTQAMQNQTLELPEPNSKTKILYSETPQQEREERTTGDKGRAAWIDSRESDPRGWPRRYRRLPQISKVRTWPRSYWACKCKNWCGAFWLAWW